MALHAVARGDTYLSPSVSRKLVASIASGAAPSTDPLARLTGRQREILQLVAEGLSSKEIGVRPDLSLKTVESHRAQLMDRLGIHDVAGLVRFAIRTGLVAPEYQALYRGRARAYLSRQGATMLETLDLDLELTKAAGQKAIAKAGIEISLLQRAARENGIPVVLVFEGGTPPARGTRSGRLILDDAIDYTNETCEYPIEVVQTVIFALIGSGVEVASTLRIAIGVCLFVVSGLIGIRLVRKYREFAVSFEAGLDEEMQSGTAK